MALLLLMRATLKPHPEVFRKCLHVVAYSSSIFMMAISGDWVVAALCCLIFAAIVYPILQLLEHWQGYGALLVQRRPGEIKKSFLLLFCTHAALIALCWGALDKPFIAVTAILMWGTGDTMAALVGKRFGKHHIKLPLADQKKTWEGTGAMAVTAWIVGAISLIALTAYPWQVCVLLALAAAPVAAYIELISHHGNDTVTVATATAIVLCLLTLLA